MAVKKTARAVHLPGTHPGLMQRLRDAEKAELRGEDPPELDQAQKVLRPSMDAPTPDRAKSVRTIGLIDPAYRQGIDGREVLADQEAFMPGADLDAMWDELNEQQKIRAGATERFRLEIETSLKRAALPWIPPHKIGGRLDKRNLERIHKNLEAEVEAYTPLLAADSATLLRTFAQDTCALLLLCQRHQAIKGLEGADTQEILSDWIQKLVYQELISRMRGMGDRGIRRICANITLADRLYDQLKRRPGYSPRQRLLMRLIHVHQDLGHTAYAARVSYRGSKLHRAYGARIFTDELNRYRALFTYEELELARTAIATHSHYELPFKEARVLALVRAVDHLAPFAPYRVYLHLEKLPGALDYLDDMLARVEAKKPDQLLALKEHLWRYLKEQGLEEPLCHDLIAAFRPFERLADPVDLGELAGTVDELKFDGIQAIEAQLAPNPFAQKYQILFDCQQDQLQRLAGSSGIKADQLQSAVLLRFGAPDSGTLLLKRNL